MIHTPHSLRLAGTALAAVLAIASTPSLAQDAAAPFPISPEPVVVAPATPTPVAPEPVMVQQPTVQPLPEPVPEASAPPPAREPAVAPVSRARTATPPAERDAPAPQAAAPATDAAPASLPQPTIVPPVAAPATADEPPVPVLPREVAADRIDTGIVALALGGLVFLALAIWGFLAIGRRKPVRRYVAERTMTAATPAAPPVAAVPAAVAPALPAAAPATRPVEPLHAPHHPAGGLPHAGASVALPRVLPDSYDEREALFNRMVDASPDRANPFSDRKARMKRARLIMQSIGRDFGDADPWIDLSQYPHNWPELAHKRSAAA